MSIRSVLLLTVLPASGICRQPGDAVAAGAAAAGNAADGRHPDLVLAAVPLIFAVGWGRTFDRIGVRKPDAALRLNGSGNSPMNLSGAIVTKSVTVNGTLNFHYDETLLLLPATP